MSLPAPQLRAFIDRYVGYRLSGFPPGLHRGLPSRHMTFIVSVGPSIDVQSHTDPRQPPASYGCVVSGLQAGPALISHGGHQEGAAVELTPLGCQGPFGMPSRTLWNASVECADVAGAAGGELWERLQSLEGWKKRFSACDEVLTRLARTGIAVSRELLHSWRTLVRSGGTASIGMLAADVGWSRQHLARRFREEFRLVPSWRRR